MQRPRSWPTAVMASFLLALLSASRLSPATLAPFVSRPTLFALRLVGLASWYHLPGQQTASGEKYGGNGVAHRTLKFGERRILCREDQPLICASVMVVDRFGKHDPANREWDVARQVARRLHMIRRGVINVIVREIK